MLLTEKEAKKNVCPHFQYTMNEDAVIQGNRSAILGHINCMGSDCRMAWRWGELHNDQHERRGYCGISGKPEF